MDSNDETQFCRFCGKEIRKNARKCRYCHEWLVDNVEKDKISENESKHVLKSDNINKDNINENEFKSTLKNDNLGENNIGKYQPTPILRSNEPPKYSKGIAIRKLFLLNIFTFGLYGIYWFYKNSKYLKEDFGSNHDVGIRTLAFAIIPIINYIVLYDLLKDIKTLLNSEKIESFSPVLSTILYIFPIFNFWVLLDVQESFNEFWMKKDGLPLQKTFVGGELVLIVIFGGITFIYILFIYLAFMMAMSSPYYYY